MSFAPSFELAWYLFAVITGGFVLGALRIIVAAAEQGVRWHNLRVEVHSLREAHKRKLDELDARERGAGEQRRPARRRPAEVVDVAEAVEVADAVAVDAGDAMPRAA
jgi:hypothetical protein